MNAFFEHLKCGSVRKLTDSVKFLDQEFPIVGQDCEGDQCAEETRPFCYQIAVSTCVQMLYQWHFGFRGKWTPPKVLEKGVELAGIYFGMVGEKLRRLKQKPQSLDEIAWFKPYLDALLLTTLAGRTIERTRFSDYLQPKLIVETVAIPIDPAWGDAILHVASALQSKPMDLQAVDERFKASRKPYPKKLLKAWVALASGDRPKFEAALADATLAFGKSVAEDDHIRGAVAQSESILAAIAYERGWKDLSFDLPVASRLITHQSLGLA